MRHPHATALPANGTGDARHRLGADTRADLELMLASLIPSDGIPSRRESSVIDCIREVLRADKEGP